MTPKRHEACISNNIAAAADADTERELPVQSHRHWQQVMSRPDETEIEREQTKSVWQTSHRADGIETGILALHVKQYA